MQEGDSSAAAWKTAEEAIVAGDVVTLERVQRDHEQMFRGERPQSSRQGGLAPVVALLLAAGARVQPERLAGARRNPRMVAVLSRKTTDA
jgi:hypothetical protein